MRAVTISRLKSGINRLRGKGQADGLYNLTNAYITAAQTIKSRPGTVKKVTLPAGTFGLFGFGDLLQVFASSQISVPAGYNLNVILHPTIDTPLNKIYFVQPFFGRLYVVAGFANGDVVHFWLIEPDKWRATHVYVFGSQVVPTTENGYVYEVTNADMTLTWTANTDETLSDFKQPSTFNNFKYQITATTGTPIKTSDTEPVWPTTAGATVTERRYNTSSNATVPGDSTPTKPEPPDKPIPPGGKVP